MLFQIYGETAGFQLLGWLMVFVGLILANEFARRTKWGGIACFLVLPAGLTIYFISIYVGAAMGAQWALNNPTYVYMNSWFHYAKLYAATAGCIGFMILKYHWGKLGKSHGFKAFPFIIVAINILIAVASDFESAVRAGSLAGGWWLSSEGVWLYGGWWNVLNGLAGIDHSKHVISPEALRPIQALKTEYLGSRNPRLHSDETLIALSISAADNEDAKLALQQIPKLKGCQVHTSVLLSQVDILEFRKLGVELTCEPKSEHAKKLQK